MGRGLFRFQNLKKSPQVREEELSEVIGSVFGRKDVVGLQLSPVGQSCRHIARHGLQTFPQILLLQGERRFQNLLKTPLSLQEQDLRECLESMPGDMPATLAHWRKLEAYHILPPEDAPDYLRELFFSNLRALLEILESEQPTAHSTA